MYEFVGRADRQLKIRGFRVEPGEIETCLNGVAGVAASAVVAHRDAGGHLHLVGFWTQDPRQPAVAPAALAAALAQRLPDYMRPARLERLRALPLTLNGKTDRKRLQDTPLAETLREFGTDAEPAAVPLARTPVADLRAALCDVAAAVLQAPLASDAAERPLGELGFDSIRFAALSVAVTRAFGVTVEEAKFFELKTLAGVAEFLAQAGAVIPEVRPSSGALGDAAPIAIIGMDARFPGADDLGAFWRNLVAGTDAVGPMPAERAALLEIDAAAAPFAGGFIADVDKFDAPFFGLSRREATAMDPRQRLFLETAWRAIENAGIRPGALAGTRTGVFVGIVGGSDYGGESDDPGVDAGAQRILGAAASLVAGRVSYHLNLTGPSSTVDTACSGSLVALHRAVMALRAGECDQAIVGGVNLALDPATTHAAAKTGMLSPSGRCRAFDAAADGYVRGEGVVALLLKPLVRAEADGDPIWALVRGTAENHGGRAAGLTAPNPDAQRDVIVAALARAGAAPDSISYLETHGTGTQLGDPIELNGLRAAWAQAGATPAARCALGAVKSHIGHLEAAAGLAGVVKTVLALRAGLLPGNLHFNQRNPKLALDGSPFRLVTRNGPWPRARDAAGRERPRRAGVSSFGFSGINAHAVLEEYPAPAVPASSAPSAAPVPVVLSAKTSAALARTAAQLAAFLGSETGAALAPEDVAWTLHAGRDAFPERLAFAARSVAEMREMLAAFASSGRVPPASADLPAPRGRRVHLPGYAFERRSYWSNRRPAAAAVSRPGAGNRLARVAADVEALDGAALGLDPAAVDRECAGLDRLEDLGRLILVAHLQRIGLLVTPGQRFDRAELRARLRAIPRYHRLSDSLGQFLQQGGFVEPDGAGGFRAGARVGDPAVIRDLADLPAAQARFLETFPDLTPHGRFVWSCVTAAPGVIDGSVRATDVMFPQGSVEFVSSIYEGNALMDYFNRVAAAAVRRTVVALLAERGPAAGPVRILEVGAGSGATTRWIAEAVAEFGDRVEYVFTDISVAFRRHGERRFAATFPFMRFQLLNIDKDPLAQGFAAASCDVVVGANVYHTIRSLHRSLQLTKALLRPGGCLVLVEGTAARILNGLTYGLLDGWWNFDDPERRLENAPLCDEAQWLRALAEEGFVGGRVLGKAGAAAKKLTQAVFVGESDGVVADDVRAETAAPAPTVATAESAIPAAPAPAPAADEIGDVLIAEILATVRRSLQARDEEIALDATFESVGVDSIIAVEIAEKLNLRFGVTLRTTDVFNYASVRRLARRIEDLLDAAGRARVMASAAPRPAASPVAEPVAATPALPAVSARPEPIAIIGMAGQFAGAADLGEFWANLAAGKDSVREIPPERWALEGFFSEDRRAPLRSYCRWGGFLKNHAGFDPFFFNVSPREADLMDPQQRLFLMTAYHALEDAGYGDRALDEQRCAVFAGVCGGDYEAHLAKAGDWGEAGAFTGNATAVLAGRIAYLLNLKGAGVAVDTACSSSLVALHLACESLRAGSCAMALAGGVAVMSSERFFIWASKAGMLSASGRCRTFGAAADGIVPAEGTGVVVLKRLSDAQRNGDHIHGLVIGSGINQNGRTNGITAPSTPAQAELETQVYRDFKIEPATLDSIECHGTGTRLGDPMEVAALTDAFRRFAPHPGGCVLGSVKSNIGHTLAAAGVAGVLKTLLALRHRELPATLHCANVNPHLALADSPFVLAREKRPWRPHAARPRRAAVSAFGFSGANAHAVIEEAPARTPDPRPVAPVHAFPFSALTPAALRRKLEQFAAWLESDEARAAAPQDVSYTLAVGRSHFEHRCAFVAATLPELAAQVRAELAAGRADTVAKPSAPAAARQAEREVLAQVRAAGADHRALLATWVALYRGGYVLDWAALHEGRAGRRVPLPGYPFELRRCWVDAAESRGADLLRAEVRTEPERAQQDCAPTITESPAPRLGLLLDTQLPAAERGVAFGKTFGANESVLAQHRVKGGAILPGVASLEMAHCAGRQLQPGAAVVLRAITWLRPLPAAAGATEAVLTLRETGDGDGWRFTLVAAAAPQTVCAQGELEFARPTSGPTLDLAAVRRRCTRAIEPDAFYRHCEAMGVDYGPYFKTVRDFRTGAGEVLARLELAPPFALELADTALHPALLDGALQAAAGLAFASEGLGRGFRYPFGAGRVDVFAPLGAAVWVHVHGSVEDGATIELTDDTGRVAVRLSGYVTRAPQTAAPSAPREALPHYVPGWEERPLPPARGVVAETAGPVWLVTRGETLLDEALAERHADVVTIRVARRSGRTGERSWDLDAGDAGAWNALIGELPRPAAVYFSPGEISADDFADELDCVRAAKEEGVLALFRLVKALQARGWWEAPLALRVAVRRVWAVDGEPAPDPYFAAIPGFVGSLGREYPQIDAVCLDVGELTPTSAGAAALAVATEPAQRDSPRVAWRHGRVFRGTLRPAEETA